MSAQPALPRGIRAAVFDMDGLLIDSEPLWRRAEIGELRAVGVQVTEAMCHDTLGLRLDEAVAHWYRRFPWTSPAPEKVEARILDRVQRLIRDEGRPMDGVPTVLEALRGRGLRLAIASTSPAALIEAVVERLGIGSLFDVRCSAQDEERGKPDPAVYLRAAARLGLEPGACLAFEDSVNGVRAAVAAGMTVVAIPCKSDFDDPDFDIAHARLHSLLHLPIAQLGAARVDGSARMRS